MSQRQFSIEKSIALFWAKVDKTDTCWLWLGGKTPKGYGLTRIGGKQLSVHRLSCELAGKTIPKRLVLDHLCRNPACINPDHLEAVTQQVNTLRGISPAALNAKKIECWRGHPLTTENVIVINNHRHCRECGRLRKRIYKQRLQTSKSAKN